MKNTGKFADYGNTLAVKPESAQVEFVYIQGKDFSEAGVKRPTRLQWQRRRVVLKLRVANSPPRIHDPWLPLASDIKILRVLKAERMAVFVGGRS